MAEQFKGWMKSCPVFSREVIATLRYQKKGLDKLEQRGWVLKSTDARARSY